MAKLIRTYVFLDPKTREALEKSAAERGVKLSEEARRILHDSLFAKGR